MQNQLPHIAFMNTISGWGGGEKWHFDYAVLLAEKGFTISFICAKNSVLHERLLAYPNIKLHFLKSTNFSVFHIGKLQKLRNFLQKSQVDQIWINFPKDLKIGALAAHQAKVKTIGYVRGIPKPIKNSFTNRWLFQKYVTNIIANSLATKKSILANNANLFPEDKIKVLYNWVAMETSHTNKKKNDVFTLGFVGRLAPEKNPLFLVRLAEILKQKGISFQFLIAGVGSLETDLRKQIHEKEVQNYFQLLGFCEDIEAVFSQLDILIVPSVWEGFGYVVVEAAKYQVPSLAFKTSSFLEIIQNEKTGKLFDMNDSNAMAETIIQLQKQPEKVEELGKQAKEFCTKHFSKEVVVNEFTKYVLQLHQANQSPPLSM